MTTKSGATVNPSFPDLFRDWMLTLQPHAFATIVTPYRQSSGERSERLLEPWTEQTERALWGPSALRIARIDDRCLWIFVAETVARRFRHVPQNRETLHHFHALVRLPSRPMRDEHQQGRIFSLQERCACLQRALFDAIDGGVPGRVARRRPANILVLPCRNDEQIAARAKYMLKESQTPLRPRWQERVAGGLCSEHGLIVLPKLPLHSPGESSPESESPRIHGRASDGVP